VNRAGPSWADRAGSTSLHERGVAGAEYLGLVTTLLQRVRLASPTGGLWEAADLQWWWRRDRHRHPERQVFWVSGETPVAAAVVTDWGDRRGCDLIGVDAGGSELMPQVWSRALEVVDRLRDRPVEMIVRDDDHALMDAVGSAGFERTGERDATLWMSARERRAPPPLPAGFDLRARAELPGSPHHMIRRNGERVAERLAECSLYRPDLDLVARSPSGEVAAYGLFWSDPVTRVGLVEPMRTEERYQGIGLARHVLMEGMSRLAALGCTRLKVSHVIGNEAARRLYVGAGFRPDSTARAYRRPAADPSETPVRRP
jgi:RimJ/RimL family protein N-acetyltransferase